MTTWTREQVAQARGIRARAEVDDTMFDRAVRDTNALADLLGALRHKLWGSMQHIAETFAIELDERDIQLHREGKNPFVSEVTAWWQPETHSVQIQGGHEDGRIYDFRGAPDEPLRIVPPPPPLGALDTTVWPDDLFEPIILECIGWHEQERHWIYGVRR